MSEEASFQDLVRRVRSGDEEAAAELVRRYEPVIHRVIHVRLIDARLRRLLDSMDICQSVLASFFVRASLGQYELQTPEDLVKLLAAMGRNKLAHQKRQHRAARRDLRRVEQVGSAAWEAPAPEASPSQQVAARDLAAEARRRLSAADRQLLEWRDQGCEWAEIAARVGGSTEALRKRLARAVEEVARQLGLDED
jgi:RNA polymerase sigma-70 factor (ECF subfamily)